MNIDSNGTTTMKRAGLFMTDAILRYREVAKLRRIHSGRHDGSAEMALLNSVEPLAFQKTIHDGELDSTARYAREYLWLRPETQFTLQSAGKLARKGILR